MNPNEYLSRILDEQTLTDDGAELKELRDRRKEVEALLREAFGASPTIRYGGSKAKGTMIKEAYDLDIICYFPRDDEDAGGTLEAIYDNVKATLSKNYLVIPKASTLPTVACSSRATRSRCPSQSETTSGYLPSVKPAGGFPGHRIGM